MQHTAKGKTTQIAGTTATAYLVATVNEGINNYELTDDFVSLDVDFNAGMDAKTMNSTAEAAAKIAKERKLKGLTATSDAKGSASFGVVDKGIYLVVQSGAKGDAENYEDFKPFLIGVPQLTEEGVNYNVVAYPKPTPKDTPKPVTPTKPVTPKTPLAKTGDTLDPKLLGACLGVGGLLVVAGTLLHHRRDDSK